MYKNGWNMSYLVLIDTLPLVLIRCFVFYAKVTLSDLKSQELWTLCWRENRQHPHNSFDNPVIQIGPNNVMVDISSMAL